jgi:patatin-related protein
MTEEERKQILEQADRYNRAEKYDLALETLNNFPPDAPDYRRCEQLRGLALARNRETEEAQLILGRLYDESKQDPTALDAETMGMYARTWMDRYDQSKDLQLLVRSRDIYAEAFERWPDNGYVGINAAAKSVLLGDFAAAAKHLQKVSNLVETNYERRLTELKTTNISDAYWLAATCAEIRLMQRQYEDAARLYREAVQIDPTASGSHDSTWLQAQRLMKALSTSDADWQTVGKAFQLGPRLELTQEVRLAVVMYGGVSLAIYINGVTQELLRLVRATSPTQLNGALGHNALHVEQLDGTEKVYRTLGQLLTRGAITEPVTDSDPIRTRFVIDILSGTSAGGINAVFLAKAMARNQHLGQIRNMWFRDADIGALMNDKGAAAGNGKTAAKSLLDSRFMYCKILEALDNMELPNQQAPRVAAVDELDLFVTTTDIHGLILPVALANRTVHEKRYRNVFHFAHAKADSRKRHFDPDFHPFLAFASRCTSAFPFAFEPMKLADLDVLLPTIEGYQSKPEQLAKYKSDSPHWHAFIEDYLQTDMQGEVLTDSFFPERSFGDGGYLDNKPFSYAIDVMLRRRADVLPVQRKLIYIEPSPEPTPAQATRPSAVDVIENVTAALLTLPRQETIREDLQRVHDRNRLIAQVEELTRNVEADIDVAGNWSQLREEKVTFRDGRKWGESDLRDMINSKGVTYGSYHRLKISNLVHELSEIIAGAAGIRSNSNERQGLPHLVRSWIDANYAEFIEEGSTKRTQNLLLVEFDIAYRLRRVGFVLAKVDQLAALDDKAKKLIQDAGEVWSEAIDTATILKNFGDSSARERILYPLIELKTKLESVYQKLRELRTRLSQPPNPNAVESAKSANPLHGLLGEPEAFQKILAKVVEKPLDADRRKMADDFRQQWSSEFNQIADGLRTELRKELIDAAETCKKILDPDRFQTIDGPMLKAIKKCLWRFYKYYEDYDHVTFPIMYQTGVGEAAKVDILRFSPKVDAGSPNSRLAGTALSNFGGFLDRTWRENDLMWGRLDAVEHILNAFLPEDHPRRKELLEQAQDIILREEILQQGADTLRGTAVQALQKARNQKLTAEGVTKFIAKLDKIPDKTLAMERDELRQFMLEKYQVDRVLDPQMVVSVMARSTQVVGKMLEGMAERRDMSTQHVTWVTRLGQWFWGLVQVAVPGSLPNLFFRHWIRLLYVFEFLMLVGGFLLVNEHVQRFGMVALALTMTVHFIVRLLGDFMHDWKRLRAAHWQRAIYFIVTAVAVWCLILGATATWIYWLGGTFERLRDPTNRLIGGGVLWLVLTSAFTLGALRAANWRALKWREAGAMKAWIAAKAIVFGAAVSLVIMGAIGMTALLFK